MGKQTFDRTKKTLGILLLVLFVISIAATAVSAITDTSKFGPISKQNYQKGYQEGADAGSAAAREEGEKQGDLDCKTGKPYSGGRDVKFNVTTKSNAAYDLGYADGYDYDYNSPLSYSVGYEKGYNDCVKSGNQNKQIARQ